MTIDIKAECAAIANAHAELARPVCPDCASASICGHEISEVYDGILYWACLDCGAAWARDWMGHERRQELAEEYAARFREAFARSSAPVEPVCVSGERAEQS